MIPMSYRHPFKKNLKLMWDQRLVHWYILKNLNTYKNKKGNTAANQDQKTKLLEQAVGLKSSQK